MKTLKYTNGNLLLNKNVQAIGHQANCQNTFGAGIARSIREMYPAAYGADTRCAEAKLNTLGSVSMACISDESRVAHGTNIELIFNLYGQNLYGNGVRQTNYDALYNALDSMAAELSDRDDSPLVVGFPYLMGCGLGGGDWNIVSRLIEVAFDGYKSDVVIVKFTL